MNPELNDKKKNPQPGSMIGIGVVFGISLGVVFGVVFDNIGLGISIGLSIGIVIGAALEQQRKEPDRNEIYDGFDIRLLVGAMSGPASVLVSDQLNFSTELTTIIAVIFAITGYIFILGGVVKECKYANMCFRQNEEKAKREKERWS